MPWPSTPGLRSSDATFRDFKLSQRLVQKADLDSLPNHCMHFEGDYDKAPPGYSQEESEFKDPGGARSQETLQLLLVMVDDRPKKMIE